jgi:hypothetical protein
MQGYENRQLATQAIQTSYEEVYEACRGGHVAPTYAALADIPQLDLVKDMEAGKTAANQFNFAPAFVMWEGKTQGRYPFEESDTHTWSRLQYRNFAYDDRTSAAVMFNNALTGKSIEKIKPPHTSKPGIRGWRPANRAASPIGVEVRWAVAYSENVAYPDRKGAAANVSALGPWSDYVRARANETPVLTIPVDPTGRASGRRIARQIKGRDPEFGRDTLVDNVAVEWSDEAV